MELYPKAQIKQRLTHIILNVKPVNSSFEVNKMTMEGKNGGMTLPGQVHIMENQYGYSYEVRFNTKDYTYVTGNAAFYDFRGEKLYTTFNSLIAGNSLEVLEDKLRNSYYGKAFIMDILTQENIPCQMVCILEDIHVPDQMVLHMIELEKMSNKLPTLEMKQRESEALLAQLDSDYYSYDRATNILTCYRYNGNKEILVKCTLEEWTEKASQVLPEESKEQLLKFEANLKNGIRNFAGSLTNKDDEKNIRFVGTAIYNGDVHVKTVGNIGNSNIKPIQEMVRRDQLTGLILKEDITNLGKKLVNDLKNKTAMAIVDIDNFKNVNDHFGHSMGDVVLKKCAAIITEQIADSGKAGRIGGDEFFVLFDNYADTEELKNALRGIKNNILQAYTDEQDGFHVSTSIGVSVYPNDADNFNTLFDLADHMLYRAKHKGKNRYIIYDPEKHGTVEEVLQTGVNEIGISGRRGLSKSEAVCRIADLDQCGQEYPIENILNDIIEYFIIERIVLYNKTDRKVELQKGAELLESEIIYETIDYLYDEDLRYFYNGNVMVINNINMFKTKSDKIYDKLESQSVYSLMHHEITGDSGKVFVISYEMITKFISWNMEDMYLYRLLDSILKKRL